MMTDHPVWDEWAVQMKGLHLRSPLEARARDAAVAYFDGESKSIALTASALGVSRNAVRTRLERAHVRGWVELGAAPALLGPRTPHRVCGRRVFWTDDVWSLASWSGDTAHPMF